MLTLRKSSDRGHANFGWLDSRHTFSFGQYHDPAHMGFGALRVINDDRVAAGGGFGTHPHANMEIITYVLDGALEHKDSLGTGSIIRPGEVQAMSAGTGITHSEFNASKSEPVHFLQIWIVPNDTGVKPRYQQKAFTTPSLPDKLQLVGSTTGRDGSLALHADVEMFSAKLDPNDSVAFDVKPGRTAWLQVARGAANLNGQPLVAGDGVAISAPSALQLAATTANTEVLLFDLAA
jgi:quercetin 2,3-dioxygenase